MPNKKATSGDIKKVVRLMPELIARVDAYRTKVEPLYGFRVSFSLAIRTLIIAGLNSQPEFLGPVDPKPASPPLKLPSPPTNIPTKKKTVSGFGSKKKDPTGLRGRRVPDDITLTESRRDVAVLLMVPPSRVEHLWATFQDHEFNRPYQDWDAVWRNWCRKDTGAGALPSADGIEELEPEMTPGEKAAALEASQATLDDGTEEWFETKRGQFDQLLQSETYNTWFKPMKIMGRNSGSFYIEVPTRAFRDWHCKEYKSEWSKGLIPGDEIFFIPSDHIEAAVHEALNPETEKGE